MTADRSHVTAGGRRVHVIDTRTGPLTPEPEHVDRLGLGARGRRVLLLAALGVALVCLVVAL